MKHLFQSSPVPKDGRYFNSVRGSPVWYGFNPRPSRRTGATLFYSILIYPKVVSILARPEGRALHARRLEQGQSTEVSILARPEGRALLVGPYPCS